MPFFSSISSSALFPSTSLKVFREHLEHSVLSCCMFSDVDSNNENILLTPFPLQCPRQKEKKDECVWSLMMRQYFREKGPENGLENYDNDMN